MKKLPWRMTGLFFLLLVGGVVNSELMAQQESSSPILASIEYASGGHQGKMAPLTDLLTALEQNFEITFLFKDEVVRRKQVNTRKIQVGGNTDLKLVEILDQLGLTYYQVDEQTYVLLPKEPHSAEDAAQEQIRGTVTDAQTGESLPGVNILVKGTSTGTSTDSEGKYELTVESLQDTLVVSYVGYQNQDIPINGRLTVNMALQSQAVSGRELVVTALGIQKEERSLGYSVAKVSGDDIQQSNTDENVLNSLAGEVAGLSVKAQGDVGSSVSVKIRGATSLAGDNQPLIVVDGVPRSNSNNNVVDFGGDDKVDFGNAISDLNPGDIKEVSVLKGPSAAALYGSRAGDGVILITTKSGTKNQPMNISVQSNTVFGKPYKFLPKLKGFATGDRPYTEDKHPGDVLTIDHGTKSFRGPQLDKGIKAVQWNSPEDENGDPIPTELVSHPDNFKNFFRTGITSTNNIALSNGTEDLSYRLSYTNMSNRGVIPNTDLYRNNLNVSLSSSITGNLEISSKISLVKKNSNNRPAGDRGANPLGELSNTNPVIDIMDLKNYWVPGKEGLQQKQYASGRNNPWFLANEAINSFDRKGVAGHVQADWQITPIFSIRGRYRLDVNEENRKGRIAKSYSKAKQGFVAFHELSSHESNVDVLGAFKNDYENFNIDASLGGNYRYNKSTIFKNSTKGAGLIVPDLYTIGNTLPTSLNYSNYMSEQAIYSIFGQVTLGYQDMVYLDLTGRNDWSSTLPEDNRSYFYPSVSLSLLLGEVLNMGSSVSRFKIRGGWAQVGRDASPYQISPTIGNAGSWGGLTRQTFPNQLLNQSLKPEINSSYEVGTDLGFFDNRLRLQGTLYQSDNKNQILSINLPQSSGYGSKLINAGLVRSKGIELSVGVTPTAVSSNWRWDIDANFSRNRTGIERLGGDLDHYTLWTDAKGGAYTEVGGTIGDIYGREPTRVEDKDSEYFGWPIVGGGGEWQSNGSGFSNAVKIGNFNPDFIMGLQTSVSYKRFRLNIGLNWHQGGEFVSQTYRYTESDVQSKRYLEDVAINYEGPREGLPQFLKDHQDEYIIGGGLNYVGGLTKETGGLEHTSGGITLHDGMFIPGVMRNTDDDGNFVGYKENLGGPGTKIIGYTYAMWDFTQMSLFDASYIKLTNLSVTYDLPNRLLRSIGLKNAGVSVYTRNVLLWTKAKIGIDPENAFQPSGGGALKEGIERYNAFPRKIPIGIKLSIDI